MLFYIFWLGVLRILYEKGQPKQCNLKCGKFFICRPVLYKFQIPFWRHIGSFHSETKQNKQNKYEKMHSNSIALYPSAAVRKKSHSVLLNSQLETC